MLHLLVLKNCVSRDETLFFLKKKKLLQPGLYASATKRRHSGNVRRLLRSFFPLPELPSFTTQLSSLSLSFLACVSAVLHQRCLWLGFLECLL